MAEYSDERYLEIEDQVEEWTDEFVDSEQFAELTGAEQREATFLVGSFAIWLYTHEVVPPEEWDEHSTRTCMTRGLPDKIRREPAYFQAVAPVLDAFFRFTDERGFIDNGDRLAETARQTADEVVEKAAAFRQRGTSGPADAASAPFQATVDVSAEGEPEELIDLRGDLTPEEEAKVREELQRRRENDPFS